MWSGVPAPRPLSEYLEGSVTVQAVGYLSLVGPVGGGGRRWRGMVLASE